MRYRLEVRLTPADTSQRVMIRWRPGPDDSKQMTDVLGSSSSMTPSLSRSAPATGNWS
jgi:hypothetical protein